MNSQERRTLQGMKSDIEHNVKQYQSFLDNKGGLSTEGFIHRMELKAKDIGQILDGTFPWEPVK